jgi:7-keto-8-aminopelargonate synthetase-like enzyme
VKLARAYGARIMLDDAHAIGVLGDGGRGTAEHFGLESEIDLIMGTHSKSLAAIGGFIAGPADVISWVKHLARSMMFSASLPPSLVASVSTALDIIEEEPELRARLWRNTHKMLKGYKTIGYDTGTSETPIIPVMIKDTMKTYEMCRPLRKSLSRSSALRYRKDENLAQVTWATHTEEQLAKVLAAFEKVGKQVGVI